MDIRPKDLVTKLGIKTQNCLNTYLGRAEFSHIKRVRIKKIVYLKGITPSDMQKLRLYVGRQSLSVEEKSKLSSKIKKLEQKEKKFKSYAEKYQKYIQS